jgi:spoIIIJ-associated protein
MTEHNNTVVDDTQTTEPSTDAGLDQGSDQSTHAADSGSEAGGSEASDSVGRAADVSIATSGDDEDAADDAADDAASDDAASDDAVADHGTAGHEQGSLRRRPAKVADLEREGEVAADFLETLLDIADLDGDIDVDVDGDRAAVSIVDSDEGRVPRRLVGQDGKVLDALQELTRLAVQSATGERSRLMLDVAGHRAERRATLVEVARTVIEQVKATGEKAALEPMTAFERKVVHDEVLAAGLASESDGVEPRRFVVVLPA